MFTNKTSDPYLSFSSSSLIFHSSSQPFDIFTDFSQSRLEMLDSFSVVHKIFHFSFPGCVSFIGNCKTASWFINVSTFSHISNLDKKTSSVKLSVRFS